MGREVGDKLGDIPDVAGPTNQLRLSTIKKRFQQLEYCNQPPYVAACDQIAARYSGSTPEGLLWLTGSRLSR